MTRLAHTRPEKNVAMTKLVYALRNAVAASVRTDGINIAEAVNAAAQAVASVLVGAYRGREREIVLSAFPDVVRAYYPAWEKIYAEFNASRPSSDGVGD